MMSRMRNVLRVLTDGQGRGGDVTNRHNTLCICLVIDIREQVECHLVFIKWNISIQLGA